MGSKTINELTLKINADMAELKSQLTNVKAELKNFQNSFTSIGVAIKKAFAIDSFENIKEKLIQFAKDIFKIGGELKGVKTAFDAMNKPDLLNQLREATKGTISDLSLMKGAVKANEFNIPVEKMATMLKFASMQAQKMGESVDYMADSITTGLARGSVLILDNLGLSSKQLNEEMKKTGDISSAAFNIMNQRLQESGGYIETAATITARWSATWENIKGGLGLMINQALIKIAPIIDEIGAKMVELWKVSSQYIIDTYNGFIDLYNKSFIFRAIIEGISISFRNVINITKLASNLIVDFFKGVGGQIAYTLNPKNWGSGFSEGLSKMMQENKNETLKDMADFGRETAKNYTESFENLLKPEAKKISSLIPEWLSSNANISGNQAGSNNTVTPASGNKGSNSEVKRIAGESISILDNLRQIEPIDLGSKINIESIKQPVADFKTSMQEMGKSVADITGLVQESLEAGFASIGEGIGNMINGDGGVKSAFAGVIGVVTNFMASFGKILIALGTARILLNKAIQTTAGAFAAIAGGIALIALSKVANNFVAKQKFALGGIVPGSSYSGDRVSILANSGEMILNSAQQSNLFKQLNGGANGGGILSARISGNDLLFVLDNARKKQSLAY